MIGKPINETRPGARNPAQIVADYADQMLEEKDRAIAEKDRELERLRAALRTIADQKGDDHILVARRALGL